MDAACVLFVYVQMLWLKVLCKYYFCMIINTLCFAVRHKRANHKLILLVRQSSQGNDVDHSDLSSKKCRGKKRHLKKQTVKTQLRVQKLIEI